MRRPCGKRCAPRLLSLVASPWKKARNGEEALETVRQGAFDLVLLDINMPGLSGIEGCRWIRGASPMAGIIMITDGG